MSMLEKLQQWADKLVRQAAPVDPAVFNDPIATKTQWVPLSRGGAGFATHRLVEVDASRLELKKSMGSFLFGGAFLAVGLGVGAKGAIDGPLPLLLVGLVFAGVGAFVAWPSSLVFDANTRQAVLRKGPVSFSTIHAVQVVKEHVRNNKSSYWSYELNLVLKDGERANVVDHADLPRIRADAQRISALIGCKFWDGTTGP